MRKSSTRLQLIFVTVVFMVVWAKISLATNQLAPLEWEHVGILAVSLGLKGWDKWVDKREIPKPPETETSGGSR